MTSLGFIVENPQFNLTPRRADFFGILNDAAKGDITIVGPEGQVVVHEAPIGIFALTICEFFVFQGGWRLDQYVDLGEVQLVYTVEHGTLRLDNVAFGDSGQWEPIGLKIEKIGFLQATDLLRQTLEECALTLEEQQMLYSNPIVKACLKNERLDYFD